MNYKYKLLIVAVGSALLAGCATDPGYDQAGEVDVRVLAINDFSGHTHQAYNCVINGKPVTSAQANGALITNLDLKLDKITKDVVDFEAKNIWVDNHKYEKDAEITKMLDAYEKIATPLENRVIGKLDRNLSRRSNSAGESSLGKVIVDAYLYTAAPKESGSAQIAFINSGGIRADLAGEQIKRLLEQQWDRSEPQILAVSNGFQYQWDSSKPKGDRVIVSSMKINGKPVKLKGKCRVVANEFLATGGSSFSVFKEGTDPVYGVPDVDAVVKYFSEKSPIAYPKQARIVDVNKK